MKEIKFKRLVVKSAVLGIFYVPTVVLIYMFDHYLGIDNIAEIFIKMIDKLSISYMFYILLFSLIVTGFYFFLGADKLVNKILSKFKFFNFYFYCSLQEVEDYFREYNIKQSSNTTNNALIAFFSTRRINSDNFSKNTLDIELINFFSYVQDKAITLYGQKEKNQTSISNIQPLNPAVIEQFFQDFWLYKENWSDDYTVIKDNKGKVIYTNLLVKKVELEQLVSKYKLPRGDVIKP